MGYSAGDGDGFVAVRLGTMRLIRAFVDLVLCRRGLMVVKILWRWIFCSCMTTSKLP